MTESKAIQASEDFGSREWNLLRLAGIGVGSVTVYPLIRKKWPTWGRIWLVGAMVTVPLYLHNYITDRPATWPFSEIEDKGQRLVAGFATSGAVAAVAVTSKKKWPAAKKEKTSTS